MTDVGIPVVIDSGSAYVKAGLAGEEVPRNVFPNVIGDNRHPSLIVDTFGGEEALKRRGLTILKYPVRDGKVSDWDAMKKMLGYTFKAKLRVDAEQHPVLITESPNFKDYDRRQFLQILFEIFKTPAAYFLNNQVLALFSQGRTTGVVVDSGYMSTHIVPVYKGHVQRCCVTRLDVGGRHLDEYLCKILTERGYSFGFSTSWEEYRRIKEKLAYVTMDMEKELSLPERVHRYTLPDGQSISVGNECYRCPEIIFQPSLIGNEQDGLHKGTNSSIMKNEVELRKSHFNNIMLVGGNSMFADMSERMYKELSHLTPNASINVRASPDRNISCWVGGAMLASMSDFISMSISHGEYCEYGVNILFRKCM